VRLVTRREARLDKTVAPFFLVCDLVVSGQL